MTSQLMLMQLTIDILCIVLLLSSIFYVPTLCMLVDFITLHIAISNVQ